MVADSAEGCDKVILVDDDVVIRVGYAEVVDSGPEAVKGSLIVDLGNLCPVLLVEVEVESACISWTSHFGRWVIALSAFELALVLADGVAQGGEEEAIDETESPSGEGNGV